MGSCSFIGLSGSCSRFCTSFVSLLIKIVSIKKKKNYICYFFIIKNSNPLSTPELYRLGQSHITSILMWEVLHNVS